MSSSEAGDEGDEVQNVSSASTRFVSRSVSQSDDQSVGQSAIQSVSRSVSQTDTVWHEIFAGSNFREFRGFFIDPRKLDPGKNKLPLKKNPRKFAPCV